MTEIATGGADLGGLEVWGMASGTPLGDMAPSPGIRDRVAAIELPSVYTQGASRIVGIGFEVVNTTAVIARQGTLTAYRLPGSHTQTSHYWQKGEVANPLAQWSFSGQFIRRPPNDIAEAMLIAGTRQWAAEEGCYSVGSFVGQDNPPILVNHVQPLIVLNPNQQEEQVQHTTPGTAGLPVLPIPTVNQTSLWIPSSCNHGQTQSNDRGSFGFKIYPINGSGAILTGLSDTTTLTLSMNVYIESFPSVEEKDILVLATPSAEYDPIALELFSHALSKAPVSVFVSENGLGDWFDGVVSAATKAAPTLSAVARMFGIPFAPQLIDSLGQAGRVYTETRPKSTKKKIEVNTNMSRNVPQITYQKVKAEGVTSKKQPTVQAQGRARARLR